MKNKAYRSEEDKNIRRFIDKARRRWSAGIFIRALLAGLSFGLAGGALVNICALFIPFYYAGAISVILVLSGITGGIIYGAVHSPDRHRSALLTDELGLEERLVTSLELSGRDDMLSVLQKEDTLQAIASFNIKDKIRIKAAISQIVVTILLAVSFIIPVFLPSAAKEAAAARHELQLQRKEEAGKVEEAGKALDKINHLDAEVKQEMEKILEEALSELLEADTKEGLNKAKERLEKKLEQELGRLADKEMAEKLDTLLADSDLMKPSEEKQDTGKLEEMAEQLEKAGKALDELLSRPDIASAALEEEVSKLLQQAEQDSLPEQVQEAFRKAMDGGGISEEDIRELARSIEEAEAELKKMDYADQDNGQKADEKEGVNSEAEKEGSEEGGPGEGKGEGNGQGSGEGKGEGDGQGRGEGSGQGSSQGSGGSGAGMNYGSKTGLEKESGKSKNHEEIMLGKEEGTDGNLKGQGESGDAFRQTGKDGISWSGRPVEYDKVAGEYRDKAYSKIENNQVPEEMKDVIRSYFDGLNQ